MRPKSIVTFEYCYLGSILLGVVNAAMTWKDVNGTVEAAQTRAMLGDWFMPLAMVFGLTISLLLWYFTARSASVVAKWVVVVFFGLSLAGFLFTLALGSRPDGIAGILSVAVLVLNAVAVWMLFRPDARAWFGETA
ncbi:MAG: hypothetical protein E7773_12690 [Sphingomonas sp.]|uniref:hypothetical protein n=1 Tax=Sphingomonas sp. TaxID=28214 RepID=UPI00121D0278|nr:hypothetical protein [Sphingomonas sp.]THD35294.1 MAG: hypothetical protein E7773_12690 [Sphingomonas sp.]